MTSPATTCAAPADLRASQAFWPDLLRQDGATAIPRWTTHPRPGIDQHAVPLPAESVTTLRALTTSLSVPLSAAYLAAHARVLADLTGERAIRTGLAQPDGPPLPCPIAVDQPSWRELILHADGLRSAIAMNAGPDYEATVQALAIAEPVFDVAVDLEGDTGLRSAADLAFALTFPVNDGELLRLTYRTDVLDADAAARIAGYHLAALSALAADPSGDPFRHSLLSSLEVRWQRDALAGAWNARPHLRAHELFEEQARRDPYAVAATDGFTQLPYGLLNARANRLARALLAHGLEREGVVAVVTDRTLDWLTAVLATFKAGGVYLPVEPAFPADRIARMLSRAGCRLVLTESESDARVDEALAGLSGVGKLAIATACSDAHDPSDLGIGVGADQLAYIYFTSGSTGEPKGAMCEHAGMLNHLLAKTEDLLLGPGDAVAQTAPQCFDISLWQLLAPLLVGGRTVLIDQDTILDAAKFIDRIDAEGVAVIQVVPSYLDVLVAHLAAHPRQLPSLRVVSTTGEALKAELATRWFAVQPGIALLNAYGLTETSDDTNHELLTGPPDGDRVPLGRPISNVRISLVDDRSALVPLGAPGEIVFSGVCVGRGYVNDPERTRAAFPPDPTQPGGRLYRSGDRGRWRPDGKLEFLGRRDAQVKVNGFRIELGEVEGRLVRLPGVRNGAVVVADRADGSRQLVAFYSAAAPLEPSALRDGLRRSLPAYMVPTLFHWQAELPTTPNGKVDTRALARIAAGLEDDAAGPSDAPRPGYEARIARAWSQILGVTPERIGRADHFFELGGTSLSALRLAVALGRALTFKEIAVHPILADQAIALARAERRAAGPPLTEGAGR
jgi:amino acid adenylation domain-containing protein